MSWSDRIVALSVVLMLLASVGLTLIYAGDRIDIERRRADRLHKRLRYARDEQ